MATQGQVAARPRRQPWSPLGRVHLITLPIAALGAVAVTAFLLLLPTGREQAVGLVAGGLLAGATVVAARGGTDTLARVLFVAAVALLPVNSVRRGGVTASDVLLVAAMATALLHPGQLHRRLVVPHRFVAGLYVFVLAGLVGSLIAQGAGLANFARLVVTMTVAVAGMLVWRPDLDQVRRLAYAWLVGNSVSVGYALVTMRSLPPWARPQGLTTHPNALGLLCALSVAFALFLHAAARGRRDRHAALLFGVVAVAGMAVSGSRAAAIAVAVVILARILLGRSVVAAVIAATGGCIGWFLLLKVSAWLPENSAPNRILHPGTSVQTSDTDRIGRLRDSIAAVEQHPWFGSGFADATAAHNVFFQVAVTTGLVGAAGFAVACWPTLSALWRPHGGPWRWLGLLPLAYFAAAMASNNLWDRYVWFCLALGMLAAARGQAPPGGPDGEPRGRVGDGGRAGAGRHRPGHPGSEPARAGQGAGGGVR
jgi:hypothetical protein